MAGLIRGVEVTSAKVHDAAKLDAVLPSEPGDVYGGSAFAGSRSEQVIAARGGKACMVRLARRVGRKRSLVTSNTIICRCTRASHCRDGIGDHVSDPATKPQRDRNRHGFRPQPSRRNAAMHLFIPGKGIKNGEDIELAGPASVAVRARNGGSTLTQSARC